MPHHTGHVIEAQADWLTVSAHGRDRAHALAELAMGIAGEEKAKKNKLRKFRLMGYEGTHCGAVEWGNRDDASCLMRLIGDQADRHLADVLPLADRVTRLDLAVTWRAEPPDPYIGRNTYTLAELWKRKHPRAPAATLINNTHGGNTCYIGTRTSEAFMRVYNKEGECIDKGDDDGAQQYRSCWRYELETKGSIPAPLAHLVAAHESRPAYVQSYVYEWARAHGLEPVFPSSGQVELQPGFRRRADADSRLKHLARNVRPTVEFLCEAGFADEVRAILGLA